MQPNSPTTPPIDPNGMMPGFTTPAEEAYKQQKIGNLPEPQAEKLLSKPLLIARNPWALVVRIVGMIIFADLSLMVAGSVGVYLFANTDQYYMLAIIGALVLIKAILLVAIVFKMTVDWVPDDYQLTERQLITRQGIANKEDKTYELANIRHVGVNQTMVGRQLEFGDITLLIATAGLNETILLRDVKDPHHYEEVFRQYLG